MYIYFDSCISDLSSIPISGVQSGNSLVENRVKQLEEENQRLLKSLAGK